MFYKGGIGVGVTSAADIITDHGEVSSECLGVRVNRRVRSGEVEPHGIDDHKHGRVEAPRHPAPVYGAVGCR